MPLRGLGPQSGDASFMNGVWQFLHDFHDEYASVGFKAKDKAGNGFISSKDFYDIMVAIKSHLLTEPVKQNLVGACQGQQVSYPYFQAFISLLSNIELMKKIYLNATDGSRTQEITKEEFVHSAQMMSQITPLEIDVLFVLCDLLHQVKISLCDVAGLLFIVAGLFPICIRQGRCDTAIL